MRTNLEGLAPVKRVDSATSLLVADLTEKLDVLKKSGTIDIKAMCSCDRNSSTRDMLWVLNNVLRLESEGEYKVTVIEC